MDKQSVYYSDIHLEVPFCGAKPLLTTSPAPQQQPIHTSTTKPAPKNLHQKAIINDLHIKRTMTQYNPYPSLKIQTNPLNTNQRTNILMN